MSLCALPIELLLQIFEHMIFDYVSPYVSPSHKNILMLRHVCRDFENLTTAVMARKGRRYQGRMRSGHYKIPFRRVEISPSSRDIQMLSAISKHQHLRHLVDDVRVRFRPLDLIGITRTDWIHEFGMDTLGALVTFSLSDEDLRKKWNPSFKCQKFAHDHICAFDENDTAVARYNLYRRNLLCQKALVAQLAEFQTLRTILGPGGFANLKGITLMEARNHCRTTEYYAGEELKYEGRLHGKLAQVKQTSNAHYEFFRLTMDGLSQRVNITTMDILGANAGMLEEFRMRHMFRYFPNVSTNLQRLNLQLFALEGQDFSTSVVYWKRMIENCTQLTWLTLDHIPDCDNSDPGSVELTECLNGLYLPRLDSFGLSNFRVRTTTLQSFLMDHSSTLTMLMLNAVAAHENDAENWKSMLKHLRKHLTFERHEVILMFYGPHLDEMTYDDEMENIVDTYGVVVDGWGARHVDGEFLEFSGLEACTCESRGDGDHFIIDLSAYLEPEGGDSDDD